VSETLDFLERVLPAEGDHWYVAAIFSGGKISHHWVRSRLQLAAELLEADRSGSTAYHACSIFNARNGGRKATNCGGVQSFWSDIDAGEGKQYETAADAQNAILEFCRGAFIPAPLFVFSGFGIHCYWPLEALVDPETWKQYANGLAAALRRNGIRHERTTDLASILRPVGTHNRKQQPARRVTMGPAVGPYQLEQFGRLLNVENVHTKTLNGHSVAARLGAIFGGHPRSSKSVVAGCVQLTIPETDSRGYVPQSLWYGALGVFAFIEVDGDDAAHEWSSGDDRYTFEETQRKLDQARALSGATTCRHFHSLNPQGCEACSHWGKINSPIALATKKEAAAGPSSFGLEIGDLPELPVDYAWRDRALCRIHEDKNGEEVALLVSKHPIYLASIHTRESKDEFAYSFNQHIPSRGWHNIVLSASDLRSAGGNGQLSRYGGNVSDYAEFTKYVTAAVDMRYTGQALSTLYEQFGWKDNDTSFLYGLDLYTASGVERVVGDRNVVTRTGTKETFVGPCGGGSLAAWTDTCNKLFAAGCEAQAVTLLASFGAVFMRFLSRDEGGAVLSLVTHASARGKSTALAAALSVWGRRQGLGLENIDSDISKGATLASIGNIPLFFDQFDTRDPAVVHEFIQIFTNGRDKRRMSRDGEIKDAGMQWQTTLISAANASLVDSIRTTGNDALANRILEISTEIPEALRQEFRGDALKDMLRNHSGHAGARFLAAIVQPENLNKAKHDLEAIIPKLWAETKLPQEFRFWIRLAASIGIAAEIVKGIGLLQFRPARIMEWLVAQMKEAAEASFDEESADQWAPRALGLFLNTFGAHGHIAVDGPFVPGQVGGFVHIKPTREIVMRSERSNGRIYISKDALRTWAVKNGLDLRTMVDALVTNGVCLNTARFLTLGAGTDYAGGRVRCIELDGRRIAGGMIENTQNVLPLRRSDPNTDNSLGGMDEEIPF
jgi:Domain of unknown function (DUF927)